MIIVLNRSSILQWFGVQSEPLTLMDCLYAFFLTDELQRESKRIDTARRVLFVLKCVCVCTLTDQYNCQHCMRPQNAEKSYCLLNLPEILCINLKRFRHDAQGSEYCCVSLSLHRLLECVYIYIGRKLSEHISFPLHGLGIIIFKHIPVKTNNFCFSLIDLSTFYPAANIDSPLLESPNTSLRSSTSVKKTQKSIVFK